MPNVRVEFRLTMPNRGSWNGEWSGSKNNYVRVKSITEKRFAELVPNGNSASFYHRWDDGWGANVALRRMQKGERGSKSDGFSGYDWMITNILDHGDTYELESSK